MVNEWQFWKLTETSVIRQKKADQFQIDKERKELFMKNELKNGIKKRQIS